MIPNVLAERYASAAIKDIWSGEGRIVLERELWIAVMKAQKELELDIPQEAICDYERVKEQVDLKSIKERERQLLHDVKSRIEEFNDLAGHEHIHKGMTSRDLTENVEQLQVFRSLQVLQVKVAAAVIQLSGRAVELKDILISGRTHNVAAQPTTMGKRLAMYAEELLLGFERLESFTANYPVRGLKGAVGTQLDSLTLFEGDQAKVAELEQKVVQYLGIGKVFTNVGQVYPRSLDFETVSIFYQISSALSNFAKQIRLMAGHELAGEGFAKGQVGSSAMPHKMNSRSCERINGFHTILNGYLNMTAGLAGDQWNEGDVSCSVVRRIALPDAVFAIDGQLETFLTVIGQMEIFPEFIRLENEKYFPFLGTTTIMMEAVKAGAGRESAHEAIKEHAIATIRDLRAGTIQSNDLVTRLANDDRIPLDQGQLKAIFEDETRLSGMAKHQVDSLA
ncbi:MAG: adenylosuccinate lyase, partial [Verrucomicrobia bacterium]|nr:adenylosuccinate lyase [Verrucomicrobiota bacterium]